VDGELLDNDLVAIIVGGGDDEAEAEPEVIDVDDNSAEAGGIYKH
jgi:hypothetical protein